MVGQLLFLHYMLRVYVCVASIWRWVGVFSHSHVLHQNIQAIAAALGLVDAPQQWAHVTGLDGLENFDNCLQMCLL